MDKKIVATQKAPAAIGPYSQAVAVGNLMFLSGQIALDPESGELLEGDVAAQTELVMKNIGAVLEAMGLTYEHLVKTTIFLASMDDFSAVNEVYGRYFEKAPPARATVEVSRLPKDVAVEISGIAVVPE